jgi:hypothetical protein
VVFVENHDHNLMLEETRKLFVQNSASRNLLYSILAHCAPQRRELHELEEFIQASPEFQTTTQPPYFLIKWLVEAGSLDEVALDEAGEDITPERVVGLTEDEVYDLIGAYTYATNDVGRAIIEEFNPKHRLITLLDIAPDRYDTYVEVLGFLTQRRTYMEVDELLRGRPVLLSGRQPGDRPMQPSVFVDKLAAAGGIGWDEGWIITEEGKELLDTLKDR